MRRSFLCPESQARAGRVQLLTLVQALLLALLLALVAVGGWKATTMRAAMTPDPFAPIHGGAEQSGANPHDPEFDHSAELADVTRRLVSNEPPRPASSSAAPPEEEPVSRVSLAQPPLEAAIPAPPLTKEEAQHPPGIHAISGVLVSDSGHFRGAAQSLLQGLRLDLVGRASPDVRQAARLNPVVDENGALVRVNFTFDALPSEEFELTLSSLDAHEWYPKSMLVVAPAVNLEFRCLDRQETVALHFEVVDAATKESIDNWSARQFRSSVSIENGVLMHAGPLDLDAFPVNSSLEWIVEAQGYAPAMGTALSFRVDPKSGDWTTRVELTRGYRVRLVVLAPNPELQPAAGAQVFLDGRSAGFTDGLGQLIVEASEMPSTAKVTWRELSVEGAFEEVCMERPHALVVTVIR